MGAVYPMQYLVAPYKWVIYNLQFNRWVNAMAVSSSVSMAIEVFIGVVSTSSEQHVDLHQARQAHDYNDAKKSCHCFDYVIQFTDHPLL